MEMGARIYYDKRTGEPFFSIGARSGDFIPSTVEQDIETYKALSERNRESFGVIELPYGAYAEDFAKSNGYRVNPETLELEFSYPDPNATEPQEPIYQKPLSEQVNELERKIEVQNQAIAEMTLLMTVGGM